MATRAVKNRCEFLISNQMLPTWRPLTIANSRTFPSPMLQLLKQCLPCAELNTRFRWTVPVTAWDEYLGGLDLGNSILRLIIETFFEVGTQRGSGRLPWQWLSQKEWYCQRCDELQYFRLSSFLPTVYQSQLSCRELELTALARKDVDLFGFKATYIPVFLHITNVEASPRQCLYRFCYSLFWGSHVLCANSGPSLLGILVHDPGLPWFTVMAGPCFPHPRGSKAWNATCIPHKMATGTAYHWFCVQLSHMIAAILKYLREQLHCPPH